ncbi:hypothetical protein EDC01DRAFT_636655 [Geopyxis carbonaria]|nr:hypothetical protein EDC01DRAFT_636655 [Geopyxis carbonaria]
MLYTSRSNDKTPTTRSAPSSSVTVTSSVKPGTENYILGSGCDLHRNTSHTTANCYSLLKRKRETQDDSDANRQCYNCREFGHRQYNCPQKRVQRRSSQRPRQAPQNSVTMASFGQAASGQSHPAQMLPFNGVIPQGFDLVTVLNLLASQAARQANVTESVSHAAPVTTRAAIMPATSSGPVTYPNTAPSSSESSSGSSATDLSDR